jgi:hypothetical protein
MDPQEILSLIINQPLNGICCCLLLLFFSLNYIMVDCTFTIALVTGNTLVANKFVWNLITSCFYETNIFKLILDITSYIMITKSIKIDAIDQFGLYFIFSIFACTLGTSAYCFIRFFATGLEEMLMEPIYGFSGVFMFTLMYARLQLGNEPVINHIPQITFNNLPLLVIIAQLILWFVGLKVFALDLPFTIMALFFSWSYLNFFYKFEESSNLGEKMDEFSFVNMFPETLHPIALPLTIAFYNIFALIGIFPELEVVEKKTTQHHLRYNDPKDAESPLLPVKQDVVLERRRAKAMKLLDAKMAELSQEPEGWGNDQDVESQRSTEASSIRI